MQAEATARANIALIKYWGKRARALNLPAVGSLSITLDGLATQTAVRFDAALEADRVVLNGRKDEAAAGRVSRFLDLLRERAGVKTRAEVISHNNFPTAAGLASSASGFAALAAAAATALKLDLSPEALSVLARQGSGSAARSIFGGFVEWHRGERDDGADSFAEVLAPREHWPLQVVIAITETAPKGTGSTDGMTQTEFTSPYFDAWVDGQEADLADARAAILSRDFEKLADVAEFSCLKMHASALAARPGVIYWNGATLEAMHTVRTLRSGGMQVFFTIDAGPQLKAICEPAAAPSVRDALAAVPGVREVIVTGIGEGVTTRSSE
ncbi:MAG TPA: diphosphomevalonate decarboxylase [Gammaproteobacteria bacterium]|nr:diphosphomevalonate decarboxylase [Gammaproteobacteria bacterium]